MIADDFEYDGIVASDFGLVVCCINTVKGDASVVIGETALNFNQVPVRNGEYYLFSNTTYDAPLEVTFEVCKLDYFTGDNRIFTQDELREISRWLCRKEPHVFRPIAKGMVSSVDTYFDGSFDVSNIYVGNHVVGLQLHFTCVRPHAVGRKISIKHTFEGDDKSFLLRDESDEVGTIYPDLLEIKCKSGGTLTINNSLEPNRTTEIKNVRANEIIRFDNMLNISTSVDEHEIQDDFNFVFFRVANKYDDRENVITTSIDCEITLEYNPIIKGVGLWI